MMLNIMLFYFFIDWYHKMVSPRAGCFLPPHSETTGQSPQKLAMMSPIAGRPLPPHSETTGQNPQKLAIFEDKINV